MGRQEGAERSLGRMARRGRRIVYPRSMARPLHPPEPQEFPDDRPPRIDESFCPVCDGRFLSPTLSPPRTIEEPASVPAPLHLPETCSELCSAILESRRAKALADPGTCPVCVEPIGLDEASGAWTGGLVITMHSRCTERGERGEFAIEPEPRHKWEKYRP